MALDALGSSCPWCSRHQNQYSPYGHLMSSAYFVPPKDRASKNESCGTLCSPLILPLMQLYIIIFLRFLKCLVLIDIFNNVEQDSKIFLQSSTASHGSRLSAMLPSPLWRFMAIFTPSMLKNLGSKASVCQCAISADRNWNLSWPLQVDPGWIGNHQDHSRIWTWCCSRFLRHFPNRILPVHHPSAMELPRDPSNISWLVRGVGMSVSKLLKPWSQNWCHPAGPKKK